MIALKNGFKLGLLSVLLLFFGLGGCARTVTDKSTLLRMRVTLNFAGPVNTATYYYYFVVGSSNPLLPEIPPYEYFPTPGKPYDQTNTTLTNKEGDILFYYTNYFDTWSDYYLIHNSQIEQFKSNSTGFPSTIDTLEQHTNDFPPVQRLQVENFSVSGSQITFTIFVQDLSVDVDRLFFNAFTTKHSDFETGVLQDLLSDTDDRSLSVLLRANELENTPSDVEESFNNGNVNKAADLISWEVLLF